VQATSSGGDNRVMGFILVGINVTVVLVAVYTVSKPNSPLREG